MKLRQYGWSFPSASPFMYSIGIVHALFMRSAVESLVFTAKP